MGPLARAALGALGAIGAVSLHDRVTAQTPTMLVGDWVPAERDVPESLPLKGTQQARTAPEPCAAPGMPALLDTRGTVEISQHSDEVRFRYSEWGTTRTVYTNPRNRPPAQEPSPLGVSFGRWERDTLAIFTTYIAHPYFDRAGTPQSAAVSVLERYTPSADGTRLEWNVTVTDAATFTAPVVIVGAMARSVSAGDPVHAAAGSDAVDAARGPLRSRETDAAAAPLVASDCVR